jgi:hypothetical protein
MDREEVLKRISNGKFFTVTFIKRSDGSLRVLNGRTGVKKNLKPEGQQPYDPKDHNLVTVYDMKVRGYRNISCERIVAIKANGVVEQILNLNN